MINALLEKDPPIYIVGLPRSGTSWFTKVLNTAPGIKNFHEPFNPDHVPEAGSYWMKYLRADDEDQEFAKFCRDAFAGRIQGKAFTDKLSRPYRMFNGKLYWLPGRVMVKDVHSCMSLEWVDAHIKPIIIIVMRHPCAVAASWLRLYEQKKAMRSLYRLLEQPRLMEHYLKPFEHLLRNDTGFLQQIGAYWGASYYVMLQQKKQHPDWILVQHEKLCQDPVEEYRKLFARLNLPWTTKTDNFLQISTTQESCEPYAIRRISAQEADKWKKELDISQIEQVNQFLRPFEIPFYSDSD